MVQITDFKNVQMSNISFSNPEKFKGSYMCYAKYSDDEQLYIQTPKMRNLDGIHKTDTRAHLDLYFQKEHVEFYNFLGDFDDNNLQIIKTKSSNWFNKDIPEDILEDLYSTPLKHKNPPKFKLKIPLSRSNVDIEIIDIENKPIEYNDIPNNCEIVVLMKFVGLKFLKEQVLSEWLPIQIKVCSKVESKIKSLIDDSLINESPYVDIQELNEEELNIDDYEDDDDDDNEEIENNDEDIKNSVQEELNSLKEKYSKKEEELNSLKSMLKKFIE